MPDINLLTENNILKMKVEEAAEHCGYTSLYKFRFDFQVKFGKQYRQKRMELKQDFIRKNHGKMSDEEIAKAIRSTKESVSQMRSVMGLKSYKSTRKSTAIVVELTNKVVTGENNPKISARILRKPIPKQHRIKIKILDSRHLAFEVLSRRKKYVEGEYFHPYMIFDAKENIERFLGRFTA